MIINKPKDKETKVRYFYNVIPIQTSKQTYWLEKFRDDMMFIADFNHDSTEWLMYKRTHVKSGEVITHHVYSDPTIPEEEKYPMVKKLREEQK